MTTVFQQALIAIAVALTAITAMFATQNPPEITVPSQSQSIAVESPINLETDDTLLAVNATILEVVSAHTWTNHGTEVNSAIRCLNNKGSTRSFITYGFFDDRGNPIKTNLWLCKEGDDWFAIVTTTLEKVGGNRIGRLITAYLVDKSKFLTIDDFISAVISKWNAREIQYVIEAGSTFLQPK